MLSIQREKHPTATLLRASLEALPFRTSIFTHLLCSRVLSHLPQTGPAFKEFARVTKRHASLLIADVHPTHRYSEMSIPTNGRKISIQTYKHPIVKTKAMAEECGFEIIGFEEFHLHDLHWKPPREHFENIYDEPTRPIFYTCSLKRL
jgi:SAM-dependent methyltransferase